MDTFNMNIGWLPLKTLFEFDILFRKYVENIVGRYNWSPAGAWSNLDYFSKVQHSAKCCAAASLSKES